MGANRILTHGTRKNIQLVLEAIFSIVFSVVVIVCALYVSGNVFELTKGRNYSDVGVHMYANSGRAALLALFTYLGIIVIVPIAIWMSFRSKIFIYTYCVINFFSCMFVFFIFMMLLS